MPELIRRVNGYNPDAYTYYPVVIVGAGESGIAMGCQLKEKLGFDQFRIFERQAGIGGTWWINRYPGVACDIPAVFYSFSFCPNPNWTSFFPEGNEIVQYLHWVCEKYQITDKIECNTDVDQCRWLEQEQVWEITLRHLVHGVGDLSSKDRRKRLDEQGPQAIYSSTEVIRAKVLVSAVGGLVEPKGWPEQIEGRNDFKGSIFHSARWEFDVDMKDKDVVVVGTGCSAAQFVPRLTKAPYNARSVTQIMRSPPWVVPRAPPPGGDEGWEKWTPTIFNYVPYSLQLMRALIFFGAEGDFNLFGGTEKSAKHRAKYEAMLLRHIKRTVPEKYQNLLTPDYGVGCKRRIFDATWFPGLNDPKLELTTQPLTAVHEKSVTLGPGTTYLGADKSAYNGPTEAREIPADVIILANGFDTTRWLHPLRVEGKNGKDLIDQMDERGGPQAYLGTAMDGFPNFFMLFGPNTATGHSSVILASENMVIHALKFIGPILKGDVNTVDVKKEAEMAFTKDLQRELKGMVWQKGGCSSWYYTQDGWNSTVYPYSQVNFALKCMFPKYSDWNIEYTSKGLLRKRLGWLLKSLAIILLFSGAYRAKQRGLSYAQVKGGFQIAALQTIIATRSWISAVRRIVR